MPSMQSTLIIATTLLGSLLQHAAAAPEAKRGAVQFPDCISTCLRNSGCFDASCVCDKAASGILSDIVICMNQWCPATVTATDLIEGLEGQCDLPKSVVQDAEKKGGVAVDTGDSGDDEDEEPSSTSAKPTVTKGSDDAKPTSTHADKGGDDLTVTYDLGAPQTNPAPTTTATTVKPATSGTLTVAGAGATGAVTTGLLTDDDDNQPTATGSLGVATSASATPSSTATKSESTGSTDDGNAASLSRQASMFAVVAAMGVALAMGF
ncbi:hypothetical protein F5Y07DRAFT_258717 [Xylaria sp. FL0933]|nr:hypothetical protein F5Y07DRAFT_258717 [Xylaria sp. FL0933]